MEGEQGGLLSPQTPKCTIRRGLNRPFWPQTGRDRPTPRKGRGGVQQPWRPYPDQTPPPPGPWTACYLRRQRRPSGSLPLSAAGQPVAVVWFAVEFACRQGETGVTAVSKVPGFCTWLPGFSTFRAGSWAVGTPCPLPGPASCWGGQAFGPFCLRGGASSGHVKATEPSPSRAQGTGRRTEHQCLRNRRGHVQRPERHLRGNQKEQRCGVGAGQAPLLTPAVPPASQRTAPPGAGSALSNSTEQKREDRPGRESVGVHSTQQSGARFPLSCVHWVQLSRGRPPAGLLSSLSSTSPGFPGGTVSGTQAPRGIFHSAFRPLTESRPL